jgi:hypothetical protein
MKILYQFLTELESDELVETGKEYALKSIMWFFERFGWLDSFEEAH